MIKTVSFQRAKQLKEAGFPQRTALFWVGLTAVSAKLVQYPNLTNVTYAAPTAEEIVERVPNKVEIDNTIWEIQLEWTLNEWHVTYGAFGLTTKSETITDALALMYLALQEQDLL